jgi:hypothetical protein
VGDEELPGVGQMTAELFRKIGLRPGTEIKLTLMAQHVIVGFFNRLDDDGLLILDSDKFAHRSTPVYVDLQTVQAVSEVKNYY